MRYLKHALLFLFIVLPLTLVGIIILYPILANLPKEATSLPFWCKWFDNADGDGLIGDIKNQKRNKLAGIDPYGTRAKYTWLAVRNPINYFKYRVLGLKIADIKILSVDNRPDIKGKRVGDYTCGGTIITEAEANNKPVYEYYKIIPYQFRGTWKCIRIRCGWKLEGMNDKAREYVSFTFVITPWHSYIGIKY